MLLKWSVILLLTKNKVWNVPILYHCHIQCIVPFKRDLFHSRSFRDTMNKRDIPQISYTIWIQKKKYAIIWLHFCFCHKIKRRNFQNFFEIVNMTNSIIVTFKKTLFHFCIYLQTIMLRFKTHIYYVIYLYTFSTFQHTSVSYFSFFLYHIFCSSSICLNLFQQLGNSNYKHICI